MKIATLLTCHNRKEKTIQCLEALYKSHSRLENSDLDVFLVDDGSTDGTSDAVKSKFPEVSVIMGSGNLFWNQGMRLAWQTAAETKQYDFYFWLNDDTILDADGLFKLFEDYNEANNMERTEVIITGACRKAFGVDEFSYGGRNEDGPVIPNHNLQKCSYINGNAVLVPNDVYLKLGNLSDDYTHGMGDFDYGLRAIKNGFTCYTTKVFMATCAPNEGVAGWCNPKFSLQKRWSQFHSPRGLNIKEYNLFRKKFWGNKWLIFALKAYLKMLVPRLYQKVVR